jgi:hypothetical protein
MGGLCFLALCGSIRDTRRSGLARWRRHLGFKPQHRKEAVKDLAAAEADRAAMIAVVNPKAIKAPYSGAGRPSRARAD